MTANSSDVIVHYGSTGDASNVSLMENGRMSDSEMVGAPPETQPLLQRKFEEKYAGERIFKPKIILLFIFYLLFSSQKEARNDFWGDNAMYTVNI